ncbi:MAG: hypothetical protein LBD28_02325 [Tannerellaceae bacterium]|jgi:hypothetical protein|nr:hypothetical protein [Tannerellaceae bacterium]
MPKYEINTWGELYKNRRNAGFKAPSDADEIYRRNGFRIIRLPNFAGLDRLRVGKIIRWIYSGSLAFRFRAGNEVHVQLTGSRMATRIVGGLRKRGLRITLLVHDVAFLRSGIDPAGEIALYNSADELIVHSQAMADELHRRGVGVPMRILTLFDYLSDDSEIYREPNIRSLVFAGNLQKSGFLTSLISEASAWNVDLHLYGASCPSIPSDPSIHPRLHYEGAFSPDNISAIKGAWGLVWDGDSPDNCDPYLIYNAPHKLSLYLAAEKPLIVWRRSALSHFVSANRLGIAVDSLRDIPVLLSQITPASYIDYAAHVAEVAAKVRQGHFLSAILHPPSPNP